MAGSGHKDDATARVGLMESSICSSPKMQICRYGELHSQRERLRQEAESSLSEGLRETRGAGEMGNSERRERVIET